MDAMQPPTKEGKQTMTHARHTPGPWLYEYNPYTSQDGREIPAFDIRADEKLFSTNEDLPPETQEANARLIAAAPEMLEALQLALRALNTAPRFRVGDTNSYAIASRIEAVLRARGINPYFRP